MNRQPPAPNLVQGWGPREAPLPGASTFHRGQDRTGYGNVAPEDGVVRSYAYAGSLGNLLIFDGDSGIRHEMGHNAALLVGVGSRQRRGVRLAVMGKTGLATGVHVHWQVRQILDAIRGIFGALFDPAVWLNGGGGSSSGHKPTDNAMEAFTMSDRLRLFYTSRNNDAEQTLIIGPADLTDPVYGKVWITCQHLPGPYPNLIGNLNSEEVVAIMGPSLLIPEALNAKMMNQPGRIAYVKDIPAPSSGGPGGAIVDLTPVLNAIAAGEAQDAKDVAAVLAKLDGVDEAVANTVAQRLTT